MTSSDRQVSAARAASSAACVSLSSAMQPPIFSSAPWMLRSTAAPGWQGPASPEARCASTDRLTSVRATDACAAHGARSFALPPAPEATGRGARGLR